MKKIVFLVLIMTAMLGFAQDIDAAEQHKQMLEALHLDWLDNSVAPQQNFYQFANGTWKINSPIPEDRAHWSSFTILQEKNLESIHVMLEKISHDDQVKPGSIEQKIGDFYFSGMDEATIDKQGITPLKDEFARIDAIQTVADIQKQIEHMHHYGIDAVFSYGSMQDFKDSTKMIGAFMQSGLSLPDRDYYLKTDKKFQDIRKAFVENMSAMLQLLGEPSSQANHEAQVVLRFETELAKASMSQIAQRDPRAIYHIKTVKKLEELSPHFAWSQYIDTMGQAREKRFNVAMPEFIAAFDKMLTTTSIADWKIYLRWHFLSAVTSSLSKPFVDEAFKMAQVLSGVEALQPRWKRVVGTESGALGFAVGEVYVREHFSPAARQQVLDMITQIRKVLRHDLTHLQWMTKKTRRAAIKKLDLIEERVGYPDKWWDYSTLEINRGPYILNVLRASAFLVKRDLDKIGKPIDRTEWAMTPQTVNAYYDPSMNNINLPMGILQSPYFDPNAPLAVNYGGIGVVIGHEITHGFDDQGSKFDGHGNLHDWWTATDLKKFKAATQCVIDQYSQFKIEGDIPVQGKLVVGEATADLGGIVLAYRAFHAAEAYKKQPTINGMTPDQQFFLSFAHIWANNIRPERAQNLILTDPHPPAQFRVNGTLANVQAFKQDFSVPEDSLMVNKTPCIIW
ncbi:MAG: M13 family metallopeptidase [Gammaproteobacteria bacterium]|nr:M13 family metallopeptidase [Gammaproteobacteria bacterium]